MNDPRGRKKTLLNNLNKIFDDPQSDDWESESIVDKKSLRERFKEKELIASGGMKNIFKVFDTKTNRYIALAELRDDVPEEQSELFLKEAYLTAALEHPNIISVYDVGIYENHYPFFTMELKVGDSLSEILKQSSQNKNEYNLVRLLNIFIKVCDAVSYAHSQNVLHLDIKPDNIQVGKFGEVQLCDWGLGSNITELNRDENKSLIKGTPGYMSPEQIDTRMKKSFETDIYSLGALLYVLLTEEAPAEGSVETVIKKTLDGSISLPKTRFPEKNIPESLNAVVCKAMSTDQADRYDSVQELQSEVEKYLSGRSTEAENAGITKEIKLFIKRNKQVSYITLVALLIILIGGSIALFQINKSKNQTVEAYETLKLAKESELKAFELYRDEKEKQLALSKEVMRMTYKDAVAKFQKPIFYTNTLDYTEDAVKSLEKYFEATDNPKVKEHLVKAYCISLDFKKALLYCDESTQEYKKLAEKFINIEKDAEGVTSMQQLLTVLKYINKEMSREIKESLFERILVYYRKKAKRLLYPTDVVKEFLICWNPDWENQVFKYDRKRAYLKISGKGLSVLQTKGPENSGEPILRFLKIDKLDISGTDFYDINHLKGLQLTLLNISNTQVTSLRHINNLTRLKTLVLNTDQIKEMPLHKYDFKINYN